ncbi:hypothetical protein M2459_001378 [Parabacteroides sp. PF5-5]|uniref:ERF family protein n=1 Tax=unclassified Parabacteroides TaxID=2649774 RepID=UPI00247436EB|nr:MULTISPECIES: ERF family protein [unclassified Parabacteroides]MDH6304642.1 hypothetical protein [Parabacteroides sp. PH5-39]MDH6315744.1 hypothetical protein [Parabacteroides sp. PF5-13]MDH6319404.1 hypothetical protein [Parabacteroides sp. PH5-13]MDH6323135.1 hypothetical protein [Parabacteroides sp. PH5-8]MDH6326937.1 hypothetical protein [Parabacteroides sp. PH5-41]
MEAKKLNLFEKIQAVANDIKTIGKDMEVGVGKSSYRAVSDKSVVKKVKEAESRHRLMSIPQKQELISQETIRSVSKDGYESIKYSFVIKLTTLFVDLDNPEIQINIESFGHGLDSGDKGFGKASTYARKYALLNAYKIATGEDADNQPSNEEKTAIKPSERRVVITNYLFKNIDTLHQVLKRFNVGELNELSESQVNTVYNGFHQKGVL